MHKPQIDAVVLHVADMQRSTEFYAMLGIELDCEKHGDGPVHYTTKLGGVHFGLYEAQAEGQASIRPTAGASMLGFQVADIDALATALLDAGVEVHTPIQNRSWGRRMIVLDPDGRCVELNQAHS